MALSGPGLPNRWLLVDGSLDGSLYQGGDYAAILAALRPTGRAWPNDPSSGQQQVLTALAPTAQRLDAAAQSLLIDAFPKTAVNLLVEWEETFDLTETDAGLTTAARQANVVERLTAVGGQSKAYFIAYAATLGFAIEIETYAPFRCALNGCGDGIGGEDWCFAWSVTVLANTGSLTDADLLAALQAVAPAETDVFLAS